MKIALLSSVLACAAGSIACAASPSEILIPGQGLFTESVTSSADGSVIVGAMGTGAIFRARPGAATAELWIKPGTDGLENVLGVFSDDKSNTLWACSFTLDPPREVSPPPSTVHAFDLTTGAPKGKWPMPSAGAECNDIAIGADGAAYVTDSANMEIASLALGAKALQVWAGNGAFGPKGGVLDGIAIVQGRVVVNALQTSKLFSVPVLANGKAGSVAEVKLDRALESPDGQRSYGKDGILIVDGGEGGRLMRITLSGEKLDAGRVTTLKTGFADGPASVTVVGDTAYVIEAQFAAMAKPKDPPTPFKAKAVTLAP